MKSYIYRDEKGMEKLEDWYQEFLNKIEAQTESVSGQTSFGSNHILKAGDESDPPLFCLHSMLTSSAHLVSELQLLLDHYHIIAPDLPSQSVRGLETCFSYKDNSFAAWLNKIVDELGQEKSNNPEIKTELMRDCKHSPPTTPEFRNWLAGRVRIFLENS